MRLAKNGYVTYLRNPGQHTNAYPTHAGWGDTPQASRYASVYYANQMPWVVTVRADRAPQWAREEASEAAEWNGVREALEAEDRARYEAWLAEQKPPGPNTVPA